VNLVVWYMYVQSSEFLDAELAAVSRITVKIFSHLATKTYDKTHLLTYVDFDLYKQ